MIVIEYFLNHTVYGNLNAELALSIYATNSDAKKATGFDILTFTIKVRRR